MANWLSKLFGRTKSSPIQTTQAKVDVKTQELEALNKEKDAGIERLKKEIEIERLKREIAEIKANLKSTPEKPEAKVDFQPPVSDEYLDSLPLRSQLTEKETFIQTLKKELADKENEINGKNSDLKTTKEELDESKKENSELKISLCSQLTEKETLIKTLEKDLAEKKNEINDKELDLKAIKKKLDESEKENSELKNSLHDIENEYTAKKQELERVKAKAQEIEEELGVKKQSLGFVGEILNAKEADSRDAIEIKEKTEAVIQFVKSNVCDTFRETSSLDEKEYKGIDYKELCDDIWKWGNFERKTWIKGKTVVAFVGEFSAGKTSIVNRILSQDKEDTKFALPVSSAPTTAVATYISAGHETSVQFTDADENLKNMPPATFMKFSKASLENINLSKLVRHFVIEYNNQHLNKLSILDTPGFSSNDREDEIRTTEVVKEADALFWVVDAHAGEINERSVQIIKKHLEDIPLFIVINKVDGKSPNERKQIQDKVKQTMEKNGIQQVVQYIEFSKKEPLNTMMKIIPAILPRKQDNRILDKIKKLSNERIKRYEEKMASAQKEIEDYRTKIKKAEGIINTNLIKKENRKEEWDTKEIQMSGLRDKTFFNFGDHANKIKEPERYWELDKRKKEIFKEVMKLDDEFADACKNRQTDTQNKSESEQNLKAFERHLQSLEQLNSKFDELTKPFN